MLRHSERTKKLASAKDGLAGIKAFSCREQQVFFAKQLASQINQKGAIYDIQSTMDIMPLVYNFSISDVRDALGYFLENVFRKHKLSGNQASLLRGIKEETLANLKLVLALSSGTKGKLNRISQAISESFSPNSPSITLAGEKNRAVDYIK